MVEVVVTDEFRGWYEDLTEDEQGAVYHVVGMLRESGVSLKFPFSSRLNGSKHALRELRVKAGGDQIRIAYAFDPARQAVLLLGAAKVGDDRFYDWFIPQADNLWEIYLKEIA